MSDKLIDVRTPLAAAEGVRVEVGRDGASYVVMPALTLHLDRAAIGQLSSTLARAMARLQRIEAAAMTPRLRMVRPEADVPPERAARPSRDRHPQP